MLKRPLILKLFTLYLLIDPFLRAVFISIEREFSLMEVLTKTFELGTLDFFNFWLLMPLSGLLLFSVKAFGLALFIILQVYSFYFHFNYVSYSWPYLSETPTVTAYILMSINIGMVLYLVMPFSRRIFFDKDLRWWERGSRYTINEPGFIYFGQDKKQITICDLAFGGCQIESTQPIENFSEVSELEFDIFKKSYKLPIEVIRNIPSDSGHRYGAKFIFNNKLQELKLRFVMLTISMNGKYTLYR